MSIQQVKSYFQQFGMESRVRELPESSATVELAAQALGVMKNEHANAHLRYYLEREKDPAVIAAMRGAIASLDVG